MVYNNIKCIVSHFKKIRNIFEKRGTTDSTHPLSFFNAGYFILANIQKPFTTPAGCSEAFEHNSLCTVYSRIHSGTKGHPISWWRNDMCVYAHVYAVEFTLD